MKKLTIFIIVSVFFLISCQQNEWKVTSPDGHLTLNIHLNPINKQAFYSVNYNMDNFNDTVLKSSPLGITREDQQFVKNLKFESISPIKLIDKKYTMLIGKDKTCRNHANEMALTFTNEKKAKVEMIFRMYNDGLALKYRFPELDTTNHKVMSEETGFSIPVKGGKAWIHPYDTARLWSPAYEVYSENEINIGTPAPAQRGWAFPALFQSSGNWILLSESGVYEDYCGSHLQQNPENGLYKIRYPEAFEWNGIPVEPESTLPWETPWRFAIIGRTPGTILESNMVNNLSKPNELNDISWIKPGRVSWSWWSDHDSPKNYKSSVKFIDFAADMGWEYSLIDANWNRMKNGGNVQDLIKYANNKGIGIILWYNSGGKHNVVTEEPRDIMDNPEKRKAEFKKLKEWGVKGVKVDFFHSDKQAAINLYLSILKDAAENHILVDFHGCTLPRGWSRTYPNLMSMEAVLGSEQYWAGSPFGEKAAKHNTILPFERNVVGPMDYTPVIFTDGGEPHTTSYAHELALSIVFESGLQHFADRISGYTERPDYVQNFLKEIPVTWDTTIYLDGIPGEKVALARKKDNIWYIGGINGQNKNRTVKFKLNFLDSNSKYTMSEINDGENSRSFVNKISEVNSNQWQKILMKPKGGFVIVLKKI